MGIFNSLARESERESESPTQDVCIRPGKEKSWQRGAMAKLYCLGYFYVFSMSKNK